ncbi:Zinc finger protein 292 [Triplophysa tibetana]|uniref:Zinc finger protein 292 n=1 Tax=Triplophysa tibetana TaxID=1572043 RepID=A0A5A9NG77_9TELE|nr:Zinc finger protein 292 [Triplophysa tibetana]
MADEEAEQDHGERVDASDALNAFSARLEEIAATLNNSVESPDERESQYCYEFCQYITSRHCHHLLTYSFSGVQEGCFYLQKNKILTLRSVTVSVKYDSLFNLWPLCSLYFHEYAIECTSEFLYSSGARLLKLLDKIIIPININTQVIMLCLAFKMLLTFTKKIYGKFVHLSTTACTVNEMRLCSYIHCILYHFLHKKIGRLEIGANRYCAYTLFLSFSDNNLLIEEIRQKIELTRFYKQNLKRLRSQTHFCLDVSSNCQMIRLVVRYVWVVIKIMLPETLKGGSPPLIGRCPSFSRPRSQNIKEKQSITLTVTALLGIRLKSHRSTKINRVLLTSVVESHLLSANMIPPPARQIENQTLPSVHHLLLDVFLALRFELVFKCNFHTHSTVVCHCNGHNCTGAVSLSIIFLLQSSKSQVLKIVTRVRLDQNDGQKKTSATLDVYGMMREDEKNNSQLFLPFFELVKAVRRTKSALSALAVKCSRCIIAHSLVQDSQMFFFHFYTNIPGFWQEWTSKAFWTDAVKCHVKRSCQLTEFLLEPTVDSYYAVETLYNEPDQKLEEKDLPVPNSLRCELILVLKTQWPFDPEKAAKGACCPVQSCRRGFKYFRNLIAHVKDHGDNEEAKRFLEMQSTKVVCQYCRRQFVSVDHLNDHLQVHCGTKPYICIQLNCKASFDSNAELIVHKKEHPGFKARCMFPGCRKIFQEAYKLYDHEAQHYKTFTCKAPDCGKVFHCQTELDLHVESHVTKKEVMSSDELPTEPHEDQWNETHQNSIQSDPHSATQAYSTNPPVGPSGALEVKHSVNNMLNSVLELSAQECVYPETGQPQTPIHLPIPQTHDNLTQTATSTHMSHLSQIGPEESLLEALMSDSDPIPSTSSYQSVLEDFLPVPATDALNGQLQTTDSAKAPLYNNTNGVYGQYSPNPLGQVQTQYSSMYNSTITSPTHAPLTSNGQACENKSVQSVNTNNTTQVVKERHKCLFDSCSRDYSSYRSVTKHMKAVHSDFYTEWKLAKKNKVAMLSTLRTVSKKGSLNLSQKVPAPAVQPQNPHAQSIPYSTNCINSGFPSVSPGVTAPTGHIQMENILDPIVISQLGTNQSHMATGHLWDTRQNSTLQQQTCHSQEMTTNINTLSGSRFTPHLNTASTEGVQHRGMNFSTLHPNNPPAPALMDSVQKLSVDSLNPLCSINQPQQVMGSNMMEAVNSVADPNLSSAQMTPYTDSLSISIPKDPLASSYSQQQGDGSFLPVPRTECVVSLKTEPNFDFPLSSNIIAPSNESSPSPRNNTSSVSNDGDKKVKRSRRTKWPAIIKDGKFICCRCYREFQSPKSLGGHLSKRVHCKPFDEADLTSDLPSSFLDLLNSPHPTPPSYVNLPIPAHPPIRGRLDPKLFPNVTYPQANGTTYSSSDKQMEEGFKQNSSNVCVSSGQEQLPNACGGYTQNNRMSETSVIQHTGSVKHQIQPRYPDSSNPLFTDAISDPLLSQLLAEDHSASTLSSGSSEHVSQILQAETVNKIETTEKSTISNASVMSNDGLLAAMESLAQNLVSEKSVKERLREQILAGDLHKISSLPRGSSIDSSCSQISVASPVPRETRCTSNLIQDATQGEQEWNTAGTSAETLLQLGDAILNEGLSQTNSSMSLGHDVNEINDTTTAIPDEISVIRKSFEKLDLDREMAEDTRTVDQPKTSDVKPNKPESKDSAIEMSTYEKPFACDANGCTYRAMTKDALFKHLIKLHNYTDNMLAEVKGQCNVSPFSCQICNKAFTRNSNLRAHYLTIHNFSQEDMRKLKSKRHSNQRLVESDSGSPCPTPVVCSQVKNMTGCKSTTTSRVDQHPKTWFPGQSYGSLLKELPPTPPLTQNPSAQIQIENQPLDKKPKPCKPRPPKPKESPKKPKEKKTEMDDSFSPYRPYRCVHHGCVAAFTIQHNLILHYKAVHQSALPKFEVYNQDEQIDEETEEKDKNEETEDKPDGEIKEVDEFRCQVKDCSCIFQNVPDLLQHYLQPHKLPLEKAGAMMCSINLGRFQCDQPDCSEMFTGFWKYINHVDREHKDIKISKVEPVEGMFRCQVEGCECAYSTRSNLLRHTMKKHHDVYKRLLMNPREGSRGGKLGRPKKYDDDAADVVEKENRETNKKTIKKACPKKCKTTKNNWTKYGKPILKTREEASAMCTKRLQLQYACMIKGCETVTGSERNIMKHYLQHGLPKQYLEEQRSNFIHCKKLPRSRYKRIASRSDDTDKSGESSVETSDNDEVAEPEPSESEFSKPTSEKESTEDPDLSDSKPSTDTCSEISVVIKRRRGRPRKGEIVRKSSGQKRTTRLRTPRSCTVSYVDLNSDSTSSSTLTQEDISDHNTPLNSFKPMGFEVSFLQFLEESRTSKRKATEQMNGEMPSRDILKLVEFKNPQKLTSLSNITFEVQKVFSGALELLLKQLHEMRPSVILEKEN